MTATTEDKKKYKLTHKQVDKTVDSPCIQVCTYDEEEEFCIGCYRTRLKKAIYIFGLFNLFIIRSNINFFRDFFI